MFVLRFFVTSLSSAAKGIFSVCHRRRSASDEEIPLGRDEEGNIAYASLESSGDSNNNGVAGSSSEELRGLTAEYTSWFESKTALMYALGNLTAYLLVAVIGYSFVFEDWPIYDSVYFAMVVFTTVGYGDLSPSTNMSRAFTVCFALYGIIILGIFLGIVGEFILEIQEENVKKRLSNARLRILEQFGEDDTALPPEKRSLLKEVTAVLLAEAPVILLLVALGTPIVLVENWDFGKGAYWMVVTGTTIGFGDLGPTQMVTRIICTFWIPLAVAVTGEVLGRIASVYIDMRNDGMEEKFLQRAMTLADLRAMDTDEDEKVAPDEFLRYMLVALQKVEEDEIDEIMEIFRKLDKSNTGFIEKQDLMDNYNFSLRPGVSITAS